MKTQLVTMAIEMAYKVLGSDAIKIYLDQLLDKIEDAVADSATPWDDKLFLPLIDGIRKGFDIPDND